MCWLIWALKMQIQDLRRDWVIMKWLNTDGFPDREIEKKREFAKRFKVKI